MSFLISTGNTQIDYFPKKASTAIAMGDALTFDGSGFATKAVAATTRVIGASLRVVVAADADYASTTAIPVIVPTTDTVFVADVGTGALTTAMIGNQYDLKDSTAIDVTASAHKQVTVVGFISATKALVKFTGNYLSAPTA